MLGVTYVIQHISLSTSVSCVKVCQKLQIQIFVSECNVRNVESPKIEFYRLMSLIELDEVI